MSTKDLKNTEAKKKLTSLAESIKIAMMVTNIGNKPLSAVPMSTKKIDDEGNIWFLSRLDSDHNVDIIQNSDVQLLYGKPSDMKFLSIFGKASISTDRDVLEDLYTSMDHTWFDGLEDPTLTALKVCPEDAYYWDTKQNKYVSLLKMGMAAVNGEQQDIGEKGKLNV